MRPTWFLSLLLALLVGFAPAPSTAKLTTAPAKVGAKKSTGLPVKSSNFDFDDNIFTTNAHVFLWDTKNNKEVAVSTASWANVKNLFGKPGEWKDYEMRQDGLRDFTDTTPAGIDLFKNQIETALQGANWQAPSWNAFVEALSKPETRKRVTIITARLHSPDAVMKGLQLLKSKGLIPALPEKANIYSVGWPGLDEKFKAPTPAESKSKVMISLIDGIDKSPISKNAPEIDDADGTGKARLNQWDFSDDDFDNFSKAVATLGREVAAKRWPNTKLILHFTGKNNPDYEPHSVVIKSDGVTREANEVESKRI